MPAPRLIALLVVLLLTPTLPAFAGEIHDAIRAGDSDRVAQLIRENPDVVHEQDSNDLRDFPIHTAAIAGETEIVEMLLDAGADIEAGDIDNTTPLGDAAIHGHSETASLLIERGADVNRRDRNAAYPLSFAVSGGDTTIVEMLLAAGSDLYHRSRYGLSLLHMAAAQNMRGLVDRLLEAKEDVNCRSAAGEVPLHWTAARQHVEMTRTLLAHGADPTIANAQGITPLQRVASEGNVAIGRLLLDWGADATVLDGFARGPLYNACRGGHSEFAQLMLAHGADPNQADSSGLRPLAMALVNGNPDVASALLEAGAEIDAPGPHFANTALHLAALKGYRDVAEALVEGGADINAENSLGDRPVELAARYGQREVAEFLTSRGAEPRNVTVASAADELSSELDEAEAIIWFLMHSGWVVKTQNHVLVFDCWYRGRESETPGLCNGHFNPAEFEGQDVTFFVSHVHSDHYDPRIFEWRDQLEDPKYIFGFQPEEETPPFTFIGAREERTIDGMKITTIDSNDTGVGFVVEVDGLAIYHAGDHANRWQDYSGPYKEEIEFIDSKGIDLDLAFMPVSGCRFRDPVAVRMGVEWTLDTLKPKVLFPMHAGDNCRRLQEFLAGLEREHKDTQKVAPNFRGDHFHYHKGKVSAMDVPERGRVQAAGNPHGS